MISSRLGLNYDLFTASVFTWKSDKLIKILLLFHTNSFLINHMGDWVITESVQ